eukprot:3513241-Amphidinium_carterae.1
MSSALQRDVAAQVTHHQESEGGPAWRGDHCIACAESASPRYNRSIPHKLCPCSQEVTPHESRCICRPPRSVMRLLVKRKGSLPSAFEAELGLMSSVETKRLSGACCHGGENHLCLPWRRTLQGQTVALGGSIGNGSKTCASRCATSGSALPACADATKPQSIPSCSPHRFACLHVSSFRRCCGHISNFGHWL